MSFFYINNEQFFKKIDDKIEKLAELKTTSKDLVTSTLSIKDVITYTLKLPISTPKEQLENEAMMQFYENAGLDLNKQYKTFFLIKELKNEESYLIEAIAVAEDTIKSKFKHIVEKTGFIDYISLSVLCFSEFYELYKKEKKRDAFVYLDNEQSFIAIYRDGEYLYSKTLNPLNALLKTLNIDYRKFTDIMESKGVNKENYDMDDFLIANEVDRFFSDYFMAINNRLSYGKNIFYLENIDNIYFYTPFEIKDIHTLKDFWEITGINFEIIPQEEINFLDRLVIFCNEKNYTNKINFSIFPKPPQFYKTKSFQLIMIILLTLLVFGGDYGYRYYQTQQLQSKLDNISHQLKIKTNKLTKLETIHKIKYNTKSDIEKNIKNIQLKINNFKIILQKSLEVKNFPKTNEDLIIISNLLKKDKLRVLTISKDENDSFDIKVFTKINNRKFIANFMNDLLHNGYKNIRTDKIYTINNEYYMSLIRFKK